MTPNSPATHQNGLANETSLYLRQHAHNPVAWQPWRGAALEQARQKDKPILLSIGYSACHWCHVMAHESFEDEATAQIMNRLFVNIKVDREERPDLDKIYQTAHHLLTQRSGGWPLTVVLSPQNQAPFFAGTYFPPEPRYGMPSFKELLEKVAAHYQQHKDEINQHNQSLVSFFNDINKEPTDANAELNSQSLDSARHQLEQNFDPKHGGFGDAPKFPHPTNIDRLLRHWALTRQQREADNNALQLAKQSLIKMALGGIYDQLAGGFYRYAVDAQWQIPHFEKMLYDNGALLKLYAQAWQADSEPLFAQVCSETAQWLIDDMRSLKGGFFATLDADSEGEEGKFYVWQRETVQQLLDGDSFALLAAHYNLNDTANFEGAWHLHVTQARPQLAQHHKLTAEQIDKTLNQARALLLKQRQQRTPPGRDEKILTAWNGLAIEGLAAAGRTLQRQAFVAAAQQAVAFIQDNLWRDQRLQASYQDGIAHLPAYLDDYAFLLSALLELLQARWSDHHLDFALTLADSLLTHFEDPVNGGFFFTAHDHEKLLYRPKTFSDDALPSGNGVAAYSLIRLGHMVGETRYLDAAERCLKSAWRQINEQPFAHNAMLAALEAFLYAPQIVILRGNVELQHQWQRSCMAGYHPNRIVVAIDQGGARLPGADLATPDDHVCAYRCDGFACSAPITNLEQLLDELNQPSSKAS